jgi:Transposase and inactivated derivatives
MILNWTHHWLTIQPPSTLARTTACTTTTGSQLLYEGRDLFEQFHETTERIAHSQSRLKNQPESSKRIDRSYRARTDAPTLKIASFETSWNACTMKAYRRCTSETSRAFSRRMARVNEKTHNFWAFRRFINRLEDVCEEYGITGNEESESWTSQECPECGKRDSTTRHEDSLACPCGFEGHACSE